MRATGTGAMPGDDLADALGFTCSELSLPFLPDLPARGQHAAMAGRALAVTDELDADIRNGRWRLTGGASRDQRRAESVLGHDLDVLEEHGVNTDVFKIQIAGPLSLAATIELPRGGLFPAVHGPTRVLALAMASGIESLIGRVRARIGSAELIVQVDEPHAPAVMAGTVSTVSGYAKHTAFDETRTDALLRAITAAIRQAGATPAVHCCAPDPPVDAFIAAGSSAIAFEPPKPADRTAPAPRTRTRPSMHSSQPAFRQSLSSRLNPMTDGHGPLINRSACGRRSSQFKTRRAAAWRHSWGHWDSPLNRSTSNSSSHRPAAWIHRRC